MIIRLGFSFKNLPAPGIPVTIFGIGSLSANSFDLSWLVFNSLTNAGGNSFKEGALKLYIDSLVKMIVFLEFFRIDEI